MQLFLFQLLLPFGLSFALGNLEERLGSDEVGARGPSPARHLPAQLHGGLRSPFEGDLQRIQESCTCCESVTQTG